MTELKDKSQRLFTTNFFLRHILMVVLYFMNIIKHRVEAHKHDIVKIKYVKVNYYHNNKYVIIMKL